MFQGRGNGWDQGSKAGCLQCFEEQKMASLAGAAGVRVTSRKSQKDKGIGVGWPGAVGSSGTSQDFAYT